MLASLERTFLAIPKVPYRFYSAAPSTNRRRFNNAKHRGREVKTITPVKDGDQQRKRQQQREKEQEVASFTEFRKEFKEDIKRYGDVTEEPNLSSFNETYDTYLKESRRLKDHIKMKKMERKHFKDLQPKLVNLLTWAEKENIRYLMETDPGNWTPDSISQAYPISPEEVESLLKDTFRLKTLKDVKKHDEGVADRIRKINTGEIPVTEDLQKKLEVRGAVPIKVGDLGINPDQFVDVKPKTDGEFARLVAPPPVHQDKPGVDKKSSVQYITDGSYYSQETEFKPEGLKQEMTMNDLRKIMRPEKRMTFSEIESKMEHSRADTVSADMKYMLDLNNVVNISSSRNDQSNASSDDHGSYDETEVPSKTKKYKVPDETGVVQLTVEGDETYLYKDDTGYQKPYTSGEIREWIEIPERLRKPGATYKVGDCYYNENGEFLYRVL